MQPLAALPDRSEASQVGAEEMSMARSPTPPPPSAPYPILSASSTSSRHLDPQLALS